LAVVNLAGENIAGRWTIAKMQRIIQSRLNATKAIVDASLDENAERGTGFLADVCEKWEAVTKSVEQIGTRCVIIRTGLVLSGQGGALPSMIKPFKFFLGGYPGTGRQWVPWITIDDEVAAIRLLIENPQLSGVFNLTSPEPVTMKYLYRSIGQVLKRPCWLPICLLTPKRESSSAQYISPRQKETNRQNPSPRKKEKART
jgi:NAD dependent epimerase/dehydratase family enzyme